MSHYRQEIVKPPFVFTPREGLLEDVLEKESGVSNKFHGINIEEHMAHCYENLPPEQQAVVRDTVGEENLPKTTKQKAPVDAPKSSTKPAEQAAEQAAEKAAKSSGKWGWILGGVALTATGIYAYNQYSHKQVQEKQLKVSA